MSKFKYRFFQWLQGLSVAVATGATKALAITAAAVGLNDQQTFNLSASWNIGITLKFFVFVFALNVLTDTFLFLAKQPPPVPQPDDEEKTH